MTDEIVVPDVPEPMLGFRIWNVDESTATLWSPVMASLPSRRRPRLAQQFEAPKGAWPVEPIKAKCGKDHQAPAADCHCGVYAAKDVETISGYLYPHTVMGLVTGGGTVIPGEYAWRAEVVSIAALFDLPYDQFGVATSRRLLDRIAARYRVPLIVPISTTPEDYRYGVRSGFADGWQLDFDGG